MSNTINQLRDEITELQKQVDDARGNGVPEDDPALLGYLRTLHARKELVEELEEFDRSAHGA